MERDRAGRLWREIGQGDHGEREERKTKKRGEGERRR